MEAGSEKVLAAGAGRPKREIIMDYSIHDALRPDLIKLCLLLRKDTEMTLNEIPREPDRKS